jgi:hypothetical protein
MEIHSWMGDYKQTTLLDGKHHVPNLSLFQTHLSHRLWNEILSVYGPARPTSTFLSIGTVLPTSGTIPSNVTRHPLDAVGGIVGAATNSEVTNILFRSLLNSFAPKGMAKKYWRFNIGDGLPDLVEENGFMKWKLLEKRDEKEVGALDDPTMIQSCIDWAKQYLDLQGAKTLINECIKSMG